MSGFHNDNGILALGLGGMVGGAILDMLSLGFAAQSLLAPLAASTLVVNLVLSPCRAPPAPPGGHRCTLPLS